MSSFHRIQPDIHADTVGNFGTSSTRNSQHTELSYIRQHEQKVKEGGQSVAVTTTAALTSFHSSGKERQKRVRWGKRTSWRRRSRRDRGGDEDEEASPHMTAVACLLVLGKDTGISQQTISLSLYPSASASLSLSLSLSLSVSPSDVLISPGPFLSLFAASFVFSVF